MSTNDAERFAELAESAKSSGAKTAGDVAADLVRSNKQRAIGFFRQRLYTLIDETDFPLVPDTFADPAAKELVDAVLPRFVDEVAAFFDSFGEDESGEDSSGA